ncbi:MAG: hypothetical protein HYW70_01610 [Candidatus Nealsonbacteria bacterium]|nr:hypothetical protein [Candidatus Nealsonbacteria bacterium]
MKPFISVSLLSIFIAGLAIPSYFLPQQKPGQFFSFGQDAAVVSLDIPDTSYIFFDKEELASKNKEFLFALDRYILRQREEKSRLTEARSENAKGIYITNSIATSNSFYAIWLRKEIENLLKETELNSVVIDVKEMAGPNLTPLLKGLVNGYRLNGYWTIARIAVFRDCSLVDKHKDWYIQNINGEPWRDFNGGCWLDPGLPDVFKYIFSVAKLAIDFGFDEIQFDYIRFPSDGDLQNMNHNVSNKADTIKEFSLRLYQEVKNEKPEIILSADLFGYIATQLNAFDIGQRMTDFASTFDYVSFMLYPSHFYGGFYIGADKKRGLPPLSLPYENTATSTVVSANPKEVVYRSVVSAIDYISAVGAKAKVRPWLQGFNLKFDLERGIVYGAETVRAQIEAAENASSSGWLIWNSANAYSKEAFLP